MFRPLKSIVLSSIVLNNVVFPGCFLNGFPCCGSGGIGTITYHLYYRNIML